MSVFAHASKKPKIVGGEVRERVEMCAFHVTYCVGFYRIHFYYHEVDEGIWEPGGHTSGKQIRRYGKDTSSLREAADAVAAEFLFELGMMLLPRMRG